MDGHRGAVQIGSWCRQDQVSQGTEKKWGEGVLYWSCDCHMILSPTLLQSSFDAGQKDVSDHDPHTIAGCIKMYLRELPEPLLKFELYSEWLKAAGLVYLLGRGY